MLRSCGYVAADEVAPVLPLPLPPAPSFHPSVVLSVTRSPGNRRTRPRLAPLYVVGVSHMLILRSESCLLTSRLRSRVTGTSYMCQRREDSARRGTHARAIAIVSTHRWSLALRPLLVQQRLCVKCQCVICLFCHPNLLSHHRQFTPVTCSFSF